jgi:ABC-type ATPase with predicted acetyltransferase domain
VADPTALSLFESQDHRCAAPSIAFGAVAIAAAAVFDYDLTRSDRSFVPMNLRPWAELQFTIGAVVGSSGSGKTQALRTINSDTAPIAWEPTRCVIDHFNNAADAMRLLGAAGLNSVPQWMKPYHTLSNGEQYRATLARQMASASRLLVIDEFTSVVDRTVARSLCDSLRRYASIDRRVIVATCHADVVGWLRPTWIAYTDSNTVARYEEAVREPWRIHVWQQVGTISRG